MATPPIQQICGHNFADLGCVTQKFCYTSQQVGMTHPTPSIGEGRKVSIPVDAAPFAPGWRQTTCRRLSRGSEEGSLGALWVNHRAIGSRRFAFRNRGASTVPRRAANRWQNTGPAGQRLSPSPHKSLSGEPGTWAVNPPVRESAPGRRCPLLRVLDTHQGPSIG